MPAINLAQLRDNSSQLAMLYMQPEIFVRKLHSFLSEYSDRTHRPGQTGDPAPLLESYNVPKPVIRQVLLDIKPLTSEDSLGGLQLCDALWEEKKFEMRYIGASILGMINPHPYAPVLERVNNWSKNISDFQLVVVLFDKGLERIRNEVPQVLIEQIDRWLDDSDMSVKRLGLHALIPLIRSTSYENIPIFFRQVSPIARALPPLLSMEMRDVIKELATRSPVETAYFLRQLITQSGSTDAAWLTRQNIRHFPPEVRKSLQELVRTPKSEK
jgi:hypothetical protein